MNLHKLRRRPDAFINIDILFSYVVKNVRSSTSPKKTLFFLYNYICKEFKLNFINELIQHSMNAIIIQVQIKRSMTSKVIEGHMRSVYVIFC